jgi:hypothetical protein
LQHACEHIGVVHFTTLALLPPLPGAPAGALPSLMLELVTDEGVRPADLLTRLVYAPQGALWALYEACLPRLQAMASGARNEALLEFLLKHVSLPAGAFVGLRDRSVAQVRAERSLHDQVRAQAATQPAGAAPERADIATGLARWAAQQPRFDWARLRAPRSFWRGAGASGGAKLALLGFWLALALLLPALVMGLVGGLLRGLDGLWIDLTGPTQAPWQAFFGALLNWAADVVHAGLQAWRRLLKALAFAGLALGLFALTWAVLSRALPPWRRWLAAWWRELNRPDDALSASLAYLLALGVLAAAAVAALAALALGAVYVWDGAEPARQLARAGSGAARAWGYRPLAIYAGLMAVTFALLWVAFQPRALPRAGKPSWLAAAWAKFRRWLTQGRPMEVPRAQQVHPSIDACEARLIAGTAHMISLTEVRRPRPWSAWWTRVVMGTVTTLGHLLFTEGRLGDAPGIHFGHWHLIDGGRRLLFCANFDGSFGGYLDDFIKGPSIGTTLFWRWTELRPRPPAAPGHPAVLHARRFPPTRLLGLRGVKCEHQFKAYARDSMVPHLFRADLIGLSLEEKLRGTALRDALFGARNPVNDDIVMRALER